MFFRHVYLFSFSDIVSLICNSTGIPHILFDAVNEEQQSLKQNYQLTLNVYPAQLILSKAYADIVQNFGWRKFTVVYDEEDGNINSCLKKSHVYSHLYSLQLVLPLAYKICCN